MVNHSQKSDCEVELICEEIKKSLSTADEQTFLKVLRKNYLSGKYLHMTKYLVVFLAILFTTAISKGQDSETEGVKISINTLFEGMRRGDSAMVRTVFAKDVVFQDVSEQNGSSRLRTQDVDGFLKAVGTPHTEAWDERMTFDRIQVDGNMASVWGSYKFYFSGKLSHCGSDSFQLFKDNGKWKIAHLIYTVYRDNCKE